jgi:predicted AAA+ superfamily ATPase
VQHLPELFPVLRVLTDRLRFPGRFIMLGSSGPDLLQKSTETLAGRIGYIELTPFLIPEILTDYSVDNLWLSGGFPCAFLNKSRWFSWMENFVFTYLERYLPQFGFTAGRSRALRLWTMLAHNHANLVNYSELARSLDLSSNTVKMYIDFLEKAFLVRQLRPYSTNLGKRIVKSHKVYIRDSGVLHYLLGIEQMDELFGQLKAGASWEGFAIEQIISIAPSGRKFYFFRTHEGTELDMVVEKGGRPVAGVEIKLGSDVRPSRGNIFAANALKLSQRFVVTHDGEDYLLRNCFRVCNLVDFIIKYLPAL